MRPKYEKKDLEEAVRALRDKYRDSYHPKDKAFILLQLAFFKAVYTHNHTDRESALIKLNQYKIQYPDDVKFTRKFFIENGMLDYFTQTELFGNIENRNINDHMYHTIGCYFDNAANSGPFGLTLCVALSPVLLAAAAISGAADFDTRHHLDNNQALDLFTNLGRINENSDRQKFINDILKKNGERSKFSMSSKATKYLIDCLGPKYRLTLRQKWERLLCYATDMQNNGKAFFEIINNTAAHYLTNKFGFEKANAFFTPHNPYNPLSDVAHQMKKMFIQLHEKENTDTPDADSNIRPESK